jgi:multiple sugar transport system permease protein
MGETYKWQFEFQDRKVASAVAMVILGVSIAFTLAFLWLLRDRTEERS